MRPYSGQSSSDVNLWKIPLLLSLGSIGLFSATILIDALDAWGVVHLPAWLTMGGIDDARAILGTMLACVSTVLALIFSVSLLVLSMVATLFGPRLLQRFLKDWVTQVTIGLFMGTFVYLCLVFLVTHKDDHSTFIPQLSLITSWFLVVGSFGFLVFYSHRVATSIQNPDLIARIVDEFVPALHASETSLRPEDKTLDESTIAHHVAEGHKVASVRSGYLQTIHHAALIDAAARAGSVVHVLYRPGQFVLRGETLLSIHSGDAEKLGNIARRHIAIGRHRSPDQDFEFGIAQVVEIAIRALSPAVNDTFTGVACVDSLGEALVTAASALRTNGLWHDRHGHVRLRVRPLRLERLVRLAFDQIRQASSGNPAVMIRILDTIRRIAPMMPFEPAQAALRQQADAVWEAASKDALVTLDRLDVEAAWRRTQAGTEVRKETE